MSEASALQPIVIDTDTSSSFVCDYVAGVNRVLSLPPYMLVDNIGRNFEVWQFATGGSEPIARARYAETSHPDDPIASLLDVDIHAAFLRCDRHELLTINHYGRLRAFQLPAPGPRMEPLWERQLLGDIERIVMARDCLIGSSPRGEYTNDPAQRGIFLFEPVKPMTNELRLSFEQALADWGVVDALAVPAREDRLAVAAGRRVGVFTLTRTSTGARLGDCLWEAPLTFHCQWLHFDATQRLWAGGFRPPASAAAGDDWDACLGGDVECFGAENGVRHFTATLPESTAWGYGADPIVLAADGREVYLLGRDAALCVIDVRSGALRQLYHPFDGRGETTSLGIGHAALRDGYIYAGFSRGGFKLLRYDLPIERIEVNPEVLRS